MTPSETSLDSLFRYHRWRQRIPLGDNLETPGTNFSSEWEATFLPESLAAKTFLDVGSNDGMFSFLAESKGATRVVSTDIYHHDDNSHMTNGWNKTGIDLAKNFLNSKIEIQGKSIYELDKIEGKFDVVYCANVMSWLKDPLRALEHLASKCSNTLLLREDLSKVQSKAPMLELVHNYNSEKPTCFYNPNKAWYESTLKGMGFVNIEFKLIDEKAIAQNRIKHFIKYLIPKETEIFESPFDLISARKTEADLKPRSTYTYHDFVYFPRVGWFKKSALTLMQQHETASDSGFKYLAKKLLGMNKEWPQVNHSITATRS